MKAGEYITAYTKAKKYVFIYSTLGSLVLVALIGIPAYWLDKNLGTTPKLFVLGLIVSCLLSQILLYKKFKKYKISLP